MLRFVDVGVYVGRGECVYVFVFMGRSRRGLVVFRYFLVFVGSRNGGGGGICGLNYGW